MLPTDTSDSSSLKAPKSICTRNPALNLHPSVVIAALKTPLDFARVSYERDTKIINAASFTIEREDHTIGNIVRMQLHRDENVLFAGYQLPHPLKYKIIVRIHTTSQSSPMQAYNQAINDLDKELDFLKSQFEDYLYFIEVLVCRGGQVLDSLLRSSEFSIGTLESHVPYSKHQPEDL
ncbi:hypothetical protein Bca101_046373 [Brassica carinata]